MRYASQSVLLRSTPPGRLKVAFADERLVRLATRRFETPEVRRLTPPAQIFIERCVSRLPANSGQPTADIGCQKAAIKLIPLCSPNIACTTPR